jgi:hypothetical protein
LLSPLFTLSCIDSPLILAMPHLHLFARLCLLLGLMVASTLAFVVQKSFSSPFGLISRNQNANDR